MIKEIVINGYRIIDVQDCDLTLVASQSEAGVWYRTSEIHCTCKGFGFRQRCKHVAAVQDLRALEVTCETCGSVTFLGCDIEGCPCHREGGTW